MSGDDSGLDKAKALDELAKAKSVLMDYTEGEPLSKGWTAEKRPRDNVRLFTKAVRNTKCFLYIATVRASKEHLLRCMSDINYMKIWDLHLSRGIEEPLSESARQRTLVYQTRNISGQTEIEMKTCCEWGDVLEDAVFYTSLTVMPEDQIFPDPLEMLASGFVARDVPEGTEIRFLFQFKINAPQNVDQLQMFVADLSSWFCNFLSAAAQDPSNNSKAHSFQMPNRGSMVLDDFHNTSFQSMDLSSNLPKLPSFSSLSLPPSSAEDRAPVPRSFDVVLPAGKTLAEYWSGVFGDQQTPWLVLPGGLDRIEYANLTMQMLLSVNGELTPAILGPRDSLDFGLLEAQVASVTGGRKQFFVHFFTFHVGGPNPATVVAEGNCTGCWTALGWYVVVELRPLFVKRLGLFQLKNPLLEHARFDCFYSNSPLPALIVLASGVVIAANSAFCNYVEADMRSGVLGEHVSAVLPRHKPVVGEVLAGISTLCKSYYQLDQPRSLVLENNFGALVALSFVRGTAVHNDNLRAFLLTLLAPETINKRRRQGSLMI